MIIPECPGTSLRQLLASGQWRLGGPGRQNGWGVNRLQKLPGVGGGAWFLRLWAGGGGGGLGDNTHPTFSVNC